MDYPLTYSPHRLDADGFVREWRICRRSGPLLAVVARENAARELCGLSSVDDGWTPHPRRLVKGPAGDLNPANREPYASVTRKDVADVALAKWGIVYEAAPPVRLVHPVAMGISRTFAPAPGPDLDGGLDLVRQGLAVASRALDGVLAARAARGVTPPSTPR